MCGFFIWYFIFVIKPLSMRIVKHLLVVSVCFRRILSIPSIVRSTIFDKEAAIISYALWYPDREPDWLADIIGQNRNRSVTSTCTLTLALVAIHTHPSSKHYDVCSNGKPQQFNYHPRRPIADGSPYIKRGIPFNPELTIFAKNLTDSSRSHFKCGYLPWTRGVVFMACPLDELSCRRVDESRVNMTISSGFEENTKFGKCRNPLTVNFTTESNSLRLQKSPPVTLSLCIYSVR